ncbi:putative nucleoredoxin 1-2 [Apium graveolens]|uniref:putative nucleoredoxin 1-2 n=1 Tax=Apium graveolens TaxID=4045 RepID=UPI003D7B6D58
MQPRKNRVQDRTNINPGLKQKNMLEDSIWSIEPITLKVKPGDEVILEDILVSPEYRVTKGYLVKELQEWYTDKYVCIFMLSMSSAHAKSTVLDTIMLRDVQHQIESSGAIFKVICVPTHFQADLEKEHSDDDEYIFNPYQHHLNLKFYTPFQDIDIDNHACLNQIASTLGLPKDHETTYVILSPMNGYCRKVVSIFDSDFIKWHGAEPYPFTIEKIQQLAREDEAMRSGKHDLGTLLCRPGRDFVISNDCTKVPISELQQKIVCLLFYEDNLECRKRTEELKQVYELHKNFEVVVVFPVSFGQRAIIQSGRFNKWKRELEFWKVFGDMPWLAVPFEDAKCRQLWRVFMRTKQCNDSNASNLFIIHSKEKYFEENGFQVLKETGFTNYPFIGVEVVPSAIAIRGKKLSSILEPNIELLHARDLDDAKGGLEKFKVCKLFGAPVVFLFVRASGCSEFLSRLQYYHLVASWTIDKFEVVYIPMNESAHDIASHWMLTSGSAEFKEKHLLPLFPHFFKEEITQNAEKEFTLALVTFGSFGHYFDQGITYSNSYEAAYELFLKTFPFRYDEEKENFEDVFSATRPKYFPLNSENEKKDI